MAIQPLHDLHKRRFGRNVGVGLVLVAFVALVFALTVVKVTRGDPMQAFDHTLRPEMLPAEGEATAIPTQSAPASVAAPSTAPAPTAPASSAPAAAQEASAP